MTATSIRRSGRGRPTRLIADRRLSRLTTLFARKAAQLDEQGLKAVEAALSKERAGAISVADALARLDEHARPRTGDLAGEGLSDLLSADAGRAALDTITVDDDSLDWAGSELLGAGETATALGIARSTLDNWRREGKVLAFAKGVRNFIFPIEQFEGSKPVGGLREVRTHFASGESAWEWLVTANRVTGNAPPIEWLRAGHVDEVVRAAEGALDYA